MASSSTNDHQDFDADNMLQTYLYYHMIKRGFLNTAEIFKNEAQVSTNSTVVESPTGFLQEWWSIFYDVFNSSQARYQEAKTTSSSNVPNMTDIPRNDAPLGIPQMVMNEHIRLKQSQANSNFCNMMAQSAACLRSSTQNNNENLEYLDKNVEPSLLDFIKAAKPNFLPGTVIPLDGPRETKNNEAPNLVPLSGMSLNVGDVNPILTSLMQTPSYRQHCQVLKAQTQDAVLSQAPRCTSKKKSFTAARNSTKYRKQKSNISETESSSNRETKVKEKRVNQIIRNVEPQLGEDQQIQIQPQNVEDHVDAANDENVDHRIMPFNNLKRISETIGRKNKDFSLEEVVCLRSSKKKVLSSHFSSDGKVLASVGHEKKVFIWNMKTFDYVTTEEMHSNIITDVRFKPDSNIFATSSYDRSVRLWDTTQPAKSFLNLSGHVEQVMSLDFHPRKVDLLCSCDRNNIIRLWNIKQQICMHITKGGSKQVRFQPHYGRFLATATGNKLKIIDVETNSLVFNLKGHVKDVVSICWDKSGEYVASISEESARIWSNGKCIAELHSSVSLFQSCVFHPVYSNLLVIGGYESLELWSPSESNKTWTVPAHKGLIAGLAASPIEELIASTSHDHCVKIWK